MTHRQRTVGNSKQLAARCMDIVADPRVLLTAAHSLRARGPKAPGPSGLVLHGLTRDELHEMCRALGRAIREDRYRPAPERVVRVPKSSGARTRPIVISEAQDRVAQKAAVLALGPLLAPEFDPLSFAYRPARRREQAVAVAEVFAADGYTHVLAHDLVDAFGRVPVARFLDVLHRFVPCDRLRAFAVRVLPPQSRSLGGLKQGGPLSALSLELYLSHALDRPWRRDGGDAIEVRYADDLMVMARSRAAAVRADARLRELLVPAGMLLKAPLADALGDLRTRETEWLGFRVRVDADGEWQVRLGGRAVARLGLRLDLAHRKPQPARRAVQVLRNWASQLGPAYADEDRAGVCDRAAAAVERGFTEGVSPAVVRRAWRTAAKRWSEIRKDVRANPAYRVRGVVTPPCPTATMR